MNMVAALSVSPEMPVQVPSDASEIIELLELLKTLDQPLDSAFVADGWGCMTAFQATTGNRARSGN